MRDLLAGLIALFLLVVALSLIGALQVYRRRRATARVEAFAKGARIVAELPTGSDLTLFTEDAEAFAYGERRIEKRRIKGVQLLINGAPIAAAASLAHPEAVAPVLTIIDEQFEGLLRDRWDVAIDTLDGVVTVECGAIRERVSQELARQIFDAIRAEIERPAR